MRNSANLAGMDTFVTYRLFASKLALEDLDHLVQLHLDPEVSRFLGGVRTPTMTSSYLQANLQHWAAHGFGLWLLKTADGNFVGRAGIRHIELDGVQEVEIAYTLTRNVWGKGLATEIALALVAIWTARRISQTLVGVVMKGHSASEQVLLKTGFEYERDVDFHNVRVGVFRHQRVENTSPSQGPTAAAVIERFAWARPTSTV